MTDNYDFNDAGKQRVFDIIPDNRILPVQITINPGGAGNDGLLTRAGDGNSEHLNITCTVIDGEFRKRKIFVRWTVQGTNHAEAADITRRSIKAVLESARGIKPTDASDAAKAARLISGYGDLNGVCCWIRVGVKAPTAKYSASNTVREIITPDHKEWKKLDQIPPAAALAPATPAPAPVAQKPAASIARPQWAE
jgi:hypothetical protein